MEIELAFAKYKDDPPVPPVFGDGLQMPDARL